MSSSLHSSTQISTDPRVIGPGTWYSIHIMAMSCEDTDSCLFFIRFVKAIITSFPCDKCRQHAKAFIEKHPPERYLSLTNDKDEHIGMFKWSWEFHNVANTFLEKPKISFADAWELYSDPQICYGDCDSLSDPDISLQSHTSQFQSQFQSQTSQIQPQIPQFQGQIPQIQSQTPQFQGQIPTSYFQTRYNTSSRSVPIKYGT